MVADSSMWHYPQIITSHRLYSRFGSSMIDLSERDYLGKHYFTDDIPAIDLDTYETFRGGENSRTVDAIIGVCDVRQNRVSNERLLLVELRMKYASTKRLSPTKIREKDQHSRHLLMEHPDTGIIDPMLCLVFHPDIEQQAIGWVNREKQAHSESACWYAFTPTTLCNLININRKPPYTPKEETVLAAERFHAAAIGDDIDAIDAEFENLRAYFSKCRLRYEMGECDYLKSCVATAIKEIRYDVFSADDHLLLDIILDDISTVMNIDL